MAGKKNSQKNSIKSHVDLKSIDDDTKSPIDAPSINKDNPAMNAPEHTWQGEAIQADTKSEASSAYAKHDTLASSGSNGSQDSAANAILEDIKSMMERMALQQETQVEMATQMQLIQIQSATSLLEAIKQMTNRSSKNCSLRNREVK